MFFRKSNLAIELHELVLIVSREARRP